MRILACDDDPAIPRLIQTMLEPRGHVVDVAYTTDQAIEVFEQAPHPYGLVITDIEMPGSVSGYYLGKYLREMGYTERIAVLTGGAADIPALADMVAEYWKKPGSLSAPVLIDLVAGGHPMPVRGGVVEG